MNVELIARSPSAQCYECFGDNAARVCHHCGRSICHEHDDRDLRQHGSGRIVATTRMAQCPEFSYLHAEQLYQNAAVTHCGDCAHALNSHRLARLLAALAFLLGAAAVATVYWNLYPPLSRYLPSDQVFYGGALLAAAGVVGSLVAALAARRSLARNRPPFALLAKIDRLAVEETVRGSVALDKQGNCTVAIEEPTGRLTIDAECTRRDRECLHSYRKRFHVGSQAAVSYHAGFYALKGTLPIQWHSTDVVQPNTIAVRGDAGTNSFLNDTAGRQASHIQHSYEYALLHTRQAPGGSWEGENSWPFVQVVPFVPAERDQYVLEIYVRAGWDSPAALGKASDTLIWKDVAAETAQNAVPLEIEELLLALPQSVGEVAGTEPLALTSTSGEQQHLVWQGVKLKAEEGQEQCFRIFFRHKLPHDTVINGHVHVKAPTTLSGIREVAGYFPWGGARDLPKLQLSTRIEATLKLELPPLLFQEAVLLAGDKLYECAGAGDDLVIALAKNLAADGLYLKRLVENRPQASHTDAHITNCYWDISGRSVDRLCPVVFHIAVSGEQAHERTARSKLHCQITVQGTAASAERREGIVQLRDVITASIDDTVAQYNAARTAAPATASAVRSPHADEEAVRVRALLHRLDEALLNGTISEGRYEEMRTRYTEQLRQLDTA